MALSAEPNERSRLSGFSNDEEDSTFSESSLDAVGVLVRSAAPLAFGFLLEGALNVAAVAIAGQASPLDLAIVGRGVQIYYITGCIMTTAASSVQVTLSAPMFTSSTNPKSDVGVIAQRSFFFANLCTLPVILVWFFIEPLFIYIGQPRELAQGLKSFLRWIVLALPGYALMGTAKAYLQAQSIFYPSSVINTLVLPVHMGVTWTLVNKTFLGVDGAAAAFVISNWLIGLSLVGFCAISRAKVCWGGISWKALTAGGVGFVQLLLPSFLAFASEWWSFELVSLLAGRLPEAGGPDSAPVNISAQGIIATCDMASVVVVVAISSAGLARLGNIIGHPGAGVRVAKSTVQGIFALAILAGFFMGGFYLFAKGTIARFFTDDVATQKLVQDAMLAMAVYQIGDNLQGAFAGILRSIARQTFVAYINMASFYIVGIPVGAVFAFQLNLGLKGLWYGLAFGLMFASLCEMAFYFIKVDWDVEMREAQKRVAEDEFVV
ncbi:hypothetical protein IAR50_001308 [Cryptococcus sp. DSM 104548]